VDTATPARANPAGSAASEILIRFSHRRAVPTEGKRNPANEGIVRGAGKLSMLSTTMHQCVRYHAKAGHKVARAAC
jgi:hypothetical protein